VDLSGFSHVVSAYWVDPTSGTKTAIAGYPMANHGTVQLTPSGDNATGDADWVLLFE
jgi:hypothetical protein